MTPVELVADLDSLCIRVSAAGNQLRIEAPPGIVDDELLRVLGTWKPDLLRLFRLAPGVGASTAGSSISNNSPSPVFIDLETRSVVDLRRDGARRYARHPSTEILSVVAAIDDRIIVWTPLLDAPLPTAALWPEGFGEPWPLVAVAGPQLPMELATAIAAGRALCAHNAWEFDALVWRAKGLPEPASWIDTLPAVRAAGLPGELDELGRRLLGRGKDAAGKEVLKRLCRPNPRGEFRPFNPQDGAVLVRYNIADVLLLLRVHEIAGDCPEADVLAVDRAINDRGVMFDSDLAGQLVRLEFDHVQAVQQQAERATEGAIKVGDFRRDRHLQRWLKSQGVQLPNLRKDTVADFLANNELIPDVVRCVREARQAVSRVTTSKLESAMAACDADGRIRGMLRYHKAHTGRCSLRTAPLTAMLHFLPARSAFLRNGVCARSLRP